MSGRACVPAALLAVLLGPAGRPALAADAPGREACDVAEGWRICVVVPRAGDRSRTQPMAARAHYDGGQVYVSSPWAHWSGRQWEGLIVKVLHRAPPPAAGGLREWTAWADLFDEERRGREIAAGQRRASLPPAFQVSFHEDGRGRRWTRATRVTRSMLPWVTGTEHVLVLPLDAEGRRLQLQFTCASTTGHCHQLDAIVDSVTWTAPADVPAPAEDAGDAAPP